MAIVGTVLGVTVAGAALVGAGTLAVGGIADNGFGSDSAAGLSEQAFAEVQAYWDGQISGGSSAELQVVRSGEVGRTACGTSDDAEAFYCPADDTIVLSSAFMQDARTEYGDAGVAFIVAHEYAHNVQTEVGALGEGKNTELMADALAGAWMRAAGYSDQDLREVVAAAGDFGDYAYGSGDHHGTPTERMEAALFGYNHAADLPGIVQRYS